MYTPFKPINSFSFEPIFSKQPKLKNVSTIPAEFQAGVGKVDDLASKMRERVQKEFHFSFFLRYVSAEGVL